MKYTWNTPTEKLKNYCNQISFLTEENKKYLKSEFQKLNQEDKNIIWNGLFLAPKTDNPAYRYLISLFKDDELFINDEVAFFKEKILPFQSKSNSIKMTSWFINQSSIEWFNNEFIVKNLLNTYIFSEVVHHSGIKRVFLKKLESLNNIEYNQFLDTYIKTSKQEKKEDFINILFKYSPIDMIERTKKLWDFPFSDSLKNRLGNSLIIRNDIQLMAHYKSFIIDSINHLISKKSFNGYSPTVSEMGKKLDADKINFYLSFFEKLNPDSRVYFFSSVISNAIRDNSKSVIINHLLKHKEKKPEFFSKDMLIYFTYMIIHQYKKDHIKLFIDMIFKHATKTGEIEYIKTKMYNPNNKVTFGSLTMDMNNTRFKQYLKTFLHHYLQETLDTNKINRRLKI